MIGPVVVRQSVAPVALLGHHLAVNQILTCFSGRFHGTAAEMMVTVTTNQLN